MSSFAYGIHALHTSTVPHVVGYASNGLAADSLFEVWDGPSNSRNRFRVHKDGDVILGPRTAADLAGSATDGFLLIRSMNGAPNGTPANAEDGAIPLVYDRANHELYAYSGSWRSVALT